MLRQVGVALGAAAVVTGDGFAPAPDEAVGEAAAPAVGLGKIAGTVGLGSVIGEVWSEGLGRGSGPGTSRNPATSNVIA